MFRARPLLTFAFCLVPFGFLTAQEPTFRGGAALVTVDVYPQQGGRVVEGLTREDFEVLEDGRPQKVENFDFVRIEPALTEEARRDPESGDDGNRQAADPRSRVFVAFLDQYHVGFDGSHATRKPLVETLRNLMTPADLFGVLTPKMRVQDLTLARKLQTLEEELARYWPWGERFSLARDMEEDYLAGCLRIPVTGEQSSTGSSADVRELISRRREDKTLTSLENLVAHLGRIREARTVVLLFTNGWLLYEPNRKLAEDIAARLQAMSGQAPLPGVYRGPGGQLAMRNNVDQVGDVAACAAELTRLADLQDNVRFRNLIAEANRRNVSFYPVDPRGLAVFDEPLSVNRPIDASELEAAKSGQTPLTVDITRLKTRLETMRTLANATDGLAVVDTNNLSLGLRTVVNDVSAYYLLGYYSTNPKLDGSYHRIQVRLKRPGISVKARRGYFAPVAAEEAAKAAKAVATSVEASVAEALAVLSRPGSTAELFGYGVARAGTLDVIVEIPSAQVAAGTFAQGADVEAAIATPNGAPSGIVRGRIEPASRAALLSLPVPEGSTGPWRVDVKVSAGRDRVMLEERVQIEPAPVATLLGQPIAYRAAPGPRSPIRPVADFQFRRTERVHIEWPLVKALDQRQARLLGKNGQPLAVGPTVTERQADSTAVLAVDLNLAPLNAGDYVIEVTAGAGADKERRLVAIRVVQ